MKKQSKHILGFRGIVLTAFVLLGLEASQVLAQDLKIDTRPLTPQEIKDYGLTNTTQIASGNHVVGLGQPVYLELLVKSGIVVTQAVWSLDAVLDADDDPISSAAVLTASPLPPTMPTYDSVDRVAYDLVDRAVIVPDVKGTYEISAQALTSNETLNASIEVVGSVFLGKDYVACTLCHASKQADFNLTHHASAFIDQINGEGSDHFAAYCIKCHTTGYDSAPGALNGGFDDVMLDTGWTFPTELSTNNWDNMPPELQAKANIQCESCHGPAQEHMRAGGDITKIGMSLSAGTCGQCHDAASHHVKNFEWGTSVHGQTEVDRGGSCKNCHTTAGFIDVNDPGMNEYGDIIPVTATFKEGITCVACHDPHSPGSGLHQVRGIESVTLENDHVITEGGNGLICMSCHKTRRHADTYVLGDPSRHFGPHYGVPGDMIAGQNAIEYGQNMPSSKHLTVVEDSCVGCHMQETPSDLPAYAKNKVGGHSFTLSYNDGTNAPIYLTETCVSCHGEQEDFDFGGEDYDRDGVVEGVQTEIHHLMDELAMLLPPYGSTDVVVTDLSTVQLRKAGYNYKYVKYDGSYGVHNPKYAAAILRSSIADLMGGIDIDCDGLLDSWEMEHFGDLSSQNGTDDYDGDGLNNIAEANIGTDPKLVDTDGDGFSDLLEVQGGSDPLDINDILSNDMIILSAAEIGYLPQGTNTTVKFQAMESLMGGTWKDIGPAHTNASGDWVFQFDSMRTNGNSRFYRAIEE